MPSVHEAEDSAGDSSPAVNSAPLAGVLSSCESESSDEDSDQPGVRYSPSGQDERLSGFDHEEFLEKARLSNQQYLGVFSCLVSCS
jgi:hypothetical protein